MQDEEKAGHENQERRRAGSRRRRRGGRRHRRRPVPQAEPQAQEAAAPEEAVGVVEPLLVPEEVVVEQPIAVAAPAEEPAEPAPAPTGGRRIACAVVSVTETRNPKTDVSGRTMRTHLGKAPYRVKTNRIVKDQAADIRKTVLELLNDDDLKVILFTGGTGIGVRDHTLEVIETVLEKEIPGFGETFRQLSYQEVGPAAILGRALAGVARQKFIACLPGSPQAVRLAMERILAPELPHIVEMLDR
ncbi:MAG: MogA/MoaB family molybdenum cofactor biosynthesis protein [Acidobacteriota bacterium]